MHICFYQTAFEFRAWLNDYIPLFYMDATTYK